LPPVVGNEEELARILTQSSHFNTRGVKASAFMPKDDETSVFRHGRDPLKGLWQLALDYAVGDRNLHGAAVFSARHLKSASLHADPSEPPPRHANLVGWVHIAGDPELEKARRRDQAQAIAAESELVRYET
jgi:hypothetical protein